MSQGSARGTKEIQHHSRLAAVCVIHCTRRSGAMSGSERATFDSVQTAGQGRAKAYVHAAKARRSGTRSRQHSRWERCQSCTSKQRIWVGQPESRDAITGWCALSFQRPNANIGLSLHMALGAACKIIYLAFGTCFTSTSLRNCSLRTSHITKTD